MLKHKLTTIKSRATILLKIILRKNILQNFLWWKQSIKDETRVSRGGNCRRTFNQTRPRKRILKFLPFEEEKILMIKKNSNEYSNLITGNTPFPVMLNEIIKSPLLQRGTLYWLYVWRRRLHKLFLNFQK